MTSSYLPALNSLTSRSLSGQPWSGEGCALAAAAHTERTIAAARPRSRERIRARLALGREGDSAACSRACAYARSRPVPHRDGKRRSLAVLGELRDVPHLGEHAGFLHREAHIAEVFLEALARDALQGRQQARLRTRAQEKDDFVRGR